MKTKVSARGQISIPAKIRKSCNIKKDTWIQWLVDGRRIMCIPLPDNPVEAFKGIYKGVLSTEVLLKERRRERERERRGRG